MTTTSDTTETTASAGKLTPDADSDAIRAAEIAAEPPEPTGQGEDTGKNGPGREAAKYRRQLRAVESERDQLQAQVDQLRRAEVERIAGTDGHLTRPSALWASGVTVADMLGDDGTVDRDRVLSAVGRATDALGLAVRRTPRPDPSQGARGGTTSAQDWATFLKSNA